MCIKLSIVGREFYVRYWTRCVKYAIINYIRIKKECAAMANKKNARSANKTIRLPFTKSDAWDLLRIVIGIIVLFVLLSVSLDMINDQFATKQAELVEDGKKDIGWIIITVGYIVPLILACAVPVLACVGSKKSAQRKHLVKGLIILGAMLLTFGILCPGQIKDQVEQREYCQILEERVEQEEDFKYPKTAPKLEDVIAEMERTVKWTAQAALGLAVVGAYQGVRYKKLRDGDVDEEIPEDETADDLPDVDWVPGKRENKIS